MWRRIALIGLALLLAIPPVRFVVVHRPHGIYRTSAAWDARKRLLARAKVLYAAPPPTAELHLDQWISDVDCRFVPKRSSGTTAKFDCRLQSGEIVKVKYGWTPERYGEVAATGLLHALGFPADRVAMAAHVRCFGCPRWPFEMHALAEQFLLDRAFERAIDYSSSHEFDWVSVERKLPGRAIGVDNLKGWDWQELALIDEGAGGASPAEVDALRLLAVFLAHWDNKADNQRLICADEDANTREDDDPEAPCRTPLLVMQDLGATFGPRKVQHANWAALPIWTDAAACVVSMNTLPYGGATFSPVRISEGGRTLLASRLQQLSESQIHALFHGARFPDPVTGESPARDLTPWVEAFQNKVRQIANRPPCPSAS